jgi:hypothetical protein
MASMLSVTQSRNTWVGRKSLAQLKDQELDPTRIELLSMNRDAARKRIPEAVQQAYCIVVEFTAGHPVWTRLELARGAP